MIKLKIKDKHTVHSILVDKVYFSRSTGNQSETITHTHGIRYIDGRCYESNSLLLEWEVKNTHGEKATMIHAVMDSS